MRLPRKRWEVYRIVPPGYGWKEPGEHPYWSCWTRRSAQSMAYECNEVLRNGRTDDEFAVFKARRKP
jgi:hypothetical protein